MFRLFSDTDKTAASSYYSNPDFLDSAWMNPFSLSTKTIKTVALYSLLLTSSMCKTKAETRQYQTPEEIAVALKNGQYSPDHDNLWVRVPVHIMIEDFQSKSTNDSYSALYILNANHPNDNVDLSQYATYEGYYHFPSHTDYSRYFPFQAANDSSVNATDLKMAYDDSNTLYNNPWRNLGRGRSGLTCFLTTYVMQGNKTINFRAQGMELSAQWPHSDNIYNATRDYCQRFDETWSEFTDLYDTWFGNAVVARDRYLAEEKEKADRKANHLINTVVGGWVGGSSVLCLLMFGVGFWMKIISPRIQVYRRARPLFDIEAGASSQIDGASSQIEGASSQIEGASSRSQDAYESEWGALEARIKMLSDHHPNNQAVLGLREDFNRVAEDYNCPISFAPLHHPVVLTDCNHQFSQRSLRNLIKQGDGQANCPCCRKPISEYHIEQCVDIENELDKKFDEFNKRATALEELLSSSRVSLSGSGHSLYASLPSSDEGDISINEKSAALLTV